MFSLIVLPESDEADEGGDAANDNCADGHWTPL
jgi:hypothetical protein